MQRYCFGVPFPLSATAADGLLPSPQNFLIFHYLDFSWKTDVSKTGFLIRRRVHTLQNNIPRPLCGGVVDLHFNTSVTFSLSQRGL
jgi:hypothetical protein